MDQLICASLSHTRYWYEVGMLKVPAVDNMMISVKLSVQYIPETCESVGMFLQPGKKKTVHVSWLNNKPHDPT